MNRKKRTAILLIALLAVACWLAWNKLASTTRIALVNFQQFQLTSIVGANEDRFIAYEAIPVEKTGKLKHYDCVLVFGMGLNISAEQRAAIQSVAEKGTPVLVYGATNPENNICNLDSIQKEEISDYLRNGNKKNYRNMARYIRQHIDLKKFFLTPAVPAVESASDVLYHLDEEVAFKTADEYEAYLKKHNYYKENAPKVAIVGGLTDPFGGNRDNTDSMIVSFQRAGMNVYPVSSAMKRMELLEQIRPDAVVYFAHGRLAVGQPDAAAGWLKERNIPVFSPLSILQTREEWMKDPMGMSGGFMSQSIVMPELDGGIYPYVINVQETDKDGLSRFRAIPGRLDSFTRIVSNFITLKKKKNGEKKISIYYFKGPGQETLTSQGLETVPSLYNLLKRLRAEGYKVDRLPGTEQEFEKMLMTQGAVLSTYAEGAFDDYLKNGNPALIEKAEYESWINQSVPEGLYSDVTATYGEAPGTYMSVHKEDKDYLAVARIELGNIALLPQPAAARGSDAFAIVHGAGTAPPHTYIGAYLWSRYAFQADALLHFGAHGSLEFTPGKQVALSGNDWPDCLIGSTPHFYYYTIGNIGEAMMAKRRSYATIISYLTPPFAESETRSRFRALQSKIQDYYKTEGDARIKASLAVKQIAVEMGLHRELRLDSIPATPYTAEEIEKIENFAEEIANEKIGGQLYTTGIPYDAGKIQSTVMAMSADPVAYSLAALDKQRGRVTGEQLKRKSFFTRQYTDPAKALVGQIMDGKAVDSAFVCRVAGITAKELAEAKELLAPPQRGMPAVVASSAPAKEGRPSKSSGGGHPSWIPRTGKKPDNGASPANPAVNTQQPAYTKEQKDRARAIAEVERTLSHVTNYKDALLQSPDMEMKSILNALSGGYLAPSSGGDAVANPNSVPTGRNLYAVNAEATPSETAWDKGVSLATATLERYKKEHGEYPKKVGYTFWSSEFIESEGATIAQVLYMLGVEPVRDAFGRVSDIQLIPSETLGRPRIDVVVQTSGQFRDLAASRLSLISRAVEMAAGAGNEKYGNQVSAGSTETERQLVEQGVPPGEAREMSAMRVFGGLNGMYGTGIQEMVMSGDKWENEKEIAQTYLHNMSAVYGSQKEWGENKAGLLRAALHSTDIVVQPRQSNTWGALSLDHVFEFAGGLNLAIRDVTGKDPDAFFADYRNRNNVRMQELKEAIGVESRSTLFNPAYIKEVMKGKASGAAQITELVANTYAWNVMKPDVIDNEMWDRIYDVYIKDVHDTGIQEFFKERNPQAIQEITAVMMETARKGLWKASEQQLADIAGLHTDLVREFGASGAGFSGGNIKLQDFIARNVQPEAAEQYKRQLHAVTNSGRLPDITGDGMVLKKDTVSGRADSSKNSLNGALVVTVVLAVFVLLLMVLRKKRKA